jgi:hypothetical protein
MPASTEANVRFGKKRVIVNLAGGKGAVEVSRYALAITEMERLITTIM